MVYRSGTACLITAVALCACSRDSALARAEQSCLKYPTPTARADCEGRARADDAAYRKETQKNEDAARARALADVAAQRERVMDAQRHPKNGTASDPQIATDGDIPAKKNGLCFKRASTGEVVCPN